MQRRTFLFGLAAAPLLARAAPPATMKGIEELQKGWKSYLPAGATVPSAEEPLKLSKDEWRKRLPPQASRSPSRRLPTTVATAGATIATPTFIRVRCSSIRAQWW